MSKILNKINELLKLHQTPQLTPLANEFKEDIIKLFRKDLLTGLVHLSKLYHRYHNQENDAALEADLRTFFALRWSLIQDTALTYDAGSGGPIHPLNQICIELATLIAKPHEAIASVLIPTLDVQYYATIDRTLKSLTEDNNRVLNLKSCVVTGRAVIDIHHWLDLQITRLNNNQPPFSHHLYQEGPDGTQRMLTLEEFNAKKRKPPYNNYLNYLEYEAEFKTPPLSKQDMKRFGAAFGVKREYIYDGLHSIKKYLKYLSKGTNPTVRSKDFDARLSLYNATKELINTLKSHCSKDQSEMKLDVFLANKPDIHSLIIDYVENHYNVLCDDTKKIIGKLNDVQEYFTFYRFVFLLKTAVNKLCPTERELGEGYKCHLSLAKTIESIDRILTNWHTDFLGVTGGEGHLIWIQDRIHMAKEVISNPNGVVFRNKLFQHEEDSREFLKIKLPSYIKFLDNTDINEARNCSDLAFFYHSFPENEFLKMLKRFRTTTLEKIIFRDFEASKNEMLVLLKYFISDERKDLLAIVLESAVSLGSEGEEVVFEILKRTNHRITHLEKMLEFREVPLVGTAFKLESIDLICALLKSGARFEGEYSAEKLPLIFWALINDKKNVFEALIERRTPVNIHYKNETLLLYAINHKKVDFIDMLLKHQDLDVNQPSFCDAKDHMGNIRGIHVAARDGQLSLVEKLYEKGASLAFAKSDGFTPLHLATHNRHAQVVKFIANTLRNMVVPILGYPELNRKTSQNKTAVDLAFDKSNGPCLYELLLAGASPNLSSFSELMKFAIMTADLDIICLLTEQGCSSCIFDQYDHPTPLHIAVAHNNPEAVRRLINHKNKTIHKKDKQGNTPLMAACLDKQWESVLLLIPLSKLSVKIKDSGNEYSIVSWAIKHSQPEIVNSLIINGADLSECNTLTCSLLNHAIQNSWMSVVDTLIMRRIGDSYGQAILHTALQYNHYEIFERLYRIIGRFEFGTCSLQDIQNSVLGSAQGHDIDIRFSNFILDVIINTPNGFNEMFRNLFYWSSCLPNRYLFNRLKNHIKNKFDQSSVSNALLNLAIDRDDEVEVLEIISQLDDLSEIKTANGDSLMSWSISHQHQGVHTLLLSKGERLNDNHAHQELQAVKKRTNPLLPNQDGNSPLMMAVKSNDYAAVKKILKTITDSEIHLKESFVSAPLSEAVKYAYDNHQLDLIRLFMKNAQLFSEGEMQQCIQISERFNCTKNILLINNSHNRTRNNHSSSSDINDVTKNLKKLKVSKI